MDTWRFDASTAGIFCELESLEIEIKSKTLETRSRTTAHPQKRQLVRWWYLCMDRFSRKLQIWCMGVATEMSEHGCDGIIRENLRVVFTEVGLFPRLGTAHAQIIDCV